MDTYAAAVTVIDELIEHHHDYATTFDGDDVLIALEAAGITLVQPGQVAIERRVLETLDEALDILPNPYDGDAELDNWADFINAKDMLDLALYPTGKTAEWLGLVPEQEDRDDR